MESQILVSFNCTVKIHYTGGFRRPVQHSCKFSLAAIGGSQPCIVLEGVGIGKLKKMKFSHSDLKQVVAYRIADGRLSIIAHNQEWDTIALSDVHDRQSLNHLHRLLEAVFTNTFPTVSENGRSSAAGQTPPPILTARHSPSELSSSHKGKKAYRFTPNAANWRGASMIAAAQSKKATPSNKTTPFDKATPTNKTNSFYGSRSPVDSSGVATIPTSVDRSGGRGSAKRVLILGNPDKDDRDKDFLSSSSYRAPRDSPVVQRPPLGSLSTEPQTSNVVKGNKKLEQLLREGTDPDGFANLGNTCYMNAVLQSLLGLYPFAEDLLSPHFVKNVHPNSLYRMVVMLLKCKRAKDSFESQRILLKKIKTAISSSTPKFMGFRQQDAHELLSKCLDQLKDDTEHIGNHGQNGSHDDSVDRESADSVNPVSPVIMNFESDIEHKIVCKGCGHVTQTSQVGYDFSLQLPKRVHHRANEQANLQQLFNHFFAEEEVEFTCTNCHCQQATISLQLARLPRILILHLKRYGYNYQLSENSKRVDNIRIPRYINVGHLMRVDCEPPSPFTASRPRDLYSLSPMLGRCEEKENLPTNCSMTEEPGAPTQRHAITEEPGAPTQLHSPPSKVLKVNNHEIPHTSHTLTSVTNSHTLTTTTSKANMSENDTIIISDTEEDDSHRLTNGKPQNENKHNDFQPQPNRSTGNGSTKSLLGKRKNSERFSELKDSDSLLCTKLPAESHVHSKDGLHTSLHKSTYGEDPLEFDTSTGIESGNRNEIEPMNVSDIEINAMSDSDEAQKIRNQSLAEIDAMFATVPLEKLTGYPKITQHSNLTTPTTTFVTTPTSSTQAENGHSSVNIDSSGDLPLSAVAEVKGGVDYHGDVLPFDQEQEDFQRAVRESLQTKGSDFQLEGLSEEEQLRLALELSIQDSLPPEATPSPSPCIIDGPPPTKSHTTPTPTPEKIPTETYRLVSIVNHIGKGSGGGHYISDVYSFPDHCWRTYNDSLVSEVREEDVRQRRQTTGYIFFYLHRSIFTAVSAQFGR